MEDSNFDIGIIELDKAAPSDYQPVKLIFDNQLAVGTPVIVAGFGGDSVRKTRFYGEDGSVGTHSEGLNGGILRMAYIAIYERRDTYDLLGNLETLPNHWLTIRDPNGISTTCKGDSGGPIFTDPTAAWQLGIHQGGDCNPYYESIELPLGNFQAWIESIIHA